MVYMNEDGSLGIPHDNKENEDTPIAEQSVSVSQENKEEAPEDNAPENTNTIDISHESPVEAPAEIKADSEPVDIFASQEEDTAIEEEASPARENSIRTNRQFRNRGRYQASNTNTNRSNSNVPQFFNDAVAVSTPSRPERSSKTKLLIGVIIGAVILVGAVALITSLIGKTDSKLNKVKTAFNKLASYVVSGQDSNGKTNVQFDINTSFHFSNILNSEEDFKNIIGKTKKLEEDLMKESKKLEGDPKYNKVTKAVSEQADVLYSLDILRNKPLLKQEEIETEFLANGKEAALKKIDNYYAGDEYQTVKDYIETTKNWANAVIAIAEFGQKYQCANKSTVNLACIYAKSSNEDRDMFNKQSSLAAQYARERESALPSEQDFFSSLINLSSALGDNGEQAK